MALFDEHQTLRESNEIKKFNTNVRDLPCHSQCQKPSLFSQVGYKKINKKLCLLPNKQLNPDFHMTFVHFSA